MLRIESDILQSERPGSVPSAAGYAACGEQILADNLIPNAWNVLGLEINVKP
jgi:hypothetical protein